jgi:hypothetical protein
MTNITWMKAPADLLGLGGLDVRPVYGPGLSGGLAERAVAPVATRQGTGLPAVGTALRLRPVTRQAIGHGVVTTKSFENNGTTLGIHSSRRPQS